MSLVVDTGILVSGVDTSEARHRESAQLLRDHAGALVVPAPVIPETAWFIESRLGPAAESKFLRLVTDGELSVRSICAITYWPASWMMRLRSLNLRLRGRRLDRHRCGEPGYHHRCHL